MSDWLDDLPARIGQVFIARETDGHITLCHCEDVGRTDLTESDVSEEALKIARFDAAGNFRPLKTAPNLRCGWKLRLRDLKEARLALDYFYPGRATVYCAWKNNRLTSTGLRETLDRQSGMYRAAAKISDDEAEKVIANFCRSDGGCLRTILWKTSSPFLPPEKFAASPLLCQEACNLLVAEMRKAVKE